MVFYSNNDKLICWHHLIVQNQFFLLNVDCKFFLMMLKTMGRNVIPQKRRNNPELNQILHTILALKSLCDLWKIREQLKMDKF